MDMYLGDGLYFQDDGFMVRLWCKRDNGTNWVGLEPEIIESFIRCLERSRNLKITIEKSSSPADAQPKENKKSQSTDPEDGSDTASNTR